MEDLEVTTLELWPRQAKILISEKGISINYLKDNFTNIIFPWNSDYDKERQLFSSQIQERPLFIIKPISEREIINVLNLLYEYSLTIRIVGGRHSTALQNPDIFLDMSFFKKITLNKYLVVCGGATQGEVNSFLFNKSEKFYFPGTKPNHPNSLAFPGGSAATVGVSGISTVGGIGTLRRTLGLTIDSIKSFRIVVPPKICSCEKNTEKYHGTQPLKSEYISEKSRVITASKTRNSDLFWALRGGGGANFGVVTRITYYPLKASKVILYEINWKWEQAENVLTIWQKTALTRPNTFNEDLSLFGGLDETSYVGINLTGVYVIPKGQSVIEAKQVIISEVSSLGGDLKMDEATTYARVYKKFAETRNYHNFSVGRTILTTKDVPANIVINRINMATKINGRAFIGLQLMGGKIADVSSNAMAFYPRKSKFFIDIFNFWDSPVYQTANQHWNAETFNEIYPITGPYCYLGFPIPNLPDYLNPYYGKNKDRLLRIKEAIDPAGLLKFPGSL